MCAENIFVDELSIEPCHKTMTMTFQKGLNYLKGQNGSGKTMLLDYVAGIRNDQKQRISGNENIVYINQNIFFADRLTGTDFVKFVYRLDNKSREREKFFELTEKFDIDKKVDVKTLMEKQWGLLSGGERKYLYSMVLLSLDREWYILDEPFAYLDTEKKEILWKVIEAFASEGKGVILTSHEEDSRINGSDIHVINLD